MRYRSSLITSLAVLAAASHAVRLRAQAATASDTLLARLTSEAIAANPALSASRSMARAAGDRVSAAGALPDPMLSAGVMDLTLPRFGFHQSDFTEVDVELSQEFPWPGTLGARTAAARAQARGSLAEAAVRRRGLIVRTAELYYRLRYVVTARATLERQRALLATGVEISTARYATTTAPQSDALEARVALARLDTEAADLAGEETGLRAELAALRNASETDSVRVDPIRPSDVLDQPHPAGQAALAPVNDTTTEHPRLMVRRAALEAADQSARVEALGARPDFTVMTRYGARPLGADFFSAFVGIRLPLFAGRKQSRQAEAARAEADAARASLAEEQASLAADLRGTLARARSGEERLRLLVLRVVPSADATADATLRGYRVGQVAFTTVLAAEDASYRARLDAAQAAAEHLTHLAMLEQLTSRENP
jgi:cobalt-zinc-cadmium efflux system outer membrane protein